MLNKINLDLLFENIPVVISISNVKSGEYIYVNDEFCKVLEYKKDEVIGKSAFQLNVWANPEQRKQFLEKLKTEKIIRNYEAEFLSKTGKRLTAIISILQFPIKNNLYIVSIAKDITEIKKREKLIDEKAAFFNTIFYNFKVGILVADIFTKEFYFANPTICQMLGYSEEELLKLSVFDIHPKDSVDKILNIFELQAKGEIITAEDVPCLKKDGTIFYADISTNKITIDNRDFNVGVFIDVTDRYLKEVELKETKDFLEAVFESIQDGISVLNNDLTIRYVNPVMEKWYYHNLPLIGKKCYEAYHKKNEPCQPCPSLRCLKTGKKESNIVKGPPTDLHPQWLELHTYPIKHKQTGKITGIVEFVRDITEKVNSEKEVVKLKKLESLGVLAGGIAHDFNNILTGIFGNLEIAKLKLEKSNPAYKFIEKAYNSIDRAKNLTKQLLTFAKGGEPLLEVVDLKSIIKNVVTFDLSGSKVKAHFYFPENLWHIKADKEQISQVISNLTINSKESMPDGGNIYIFAENLENFEIPEIGIKDNFIKITFKDEGKGIPEKYIDKIFDPFFSTKQIGSGLGLSIVYSIVKRHNGFISVQSEPGKGTVFEIFLPAEKEEKSMEQSQSNEIEIRNEFKNIKILIVDDEELVRNIIKEMLESVGFYVETASNSKEAIEKFKNGEFHIVILDLTIPGDIDGREIAYRILKINSSAKIILASGYSNDYVIANFKKYGFKGSITKPFKFENLISEIKKVLNNN